MNLRLFFALAVTGALALPAGAAPEPKPRDEALRLAPADFALVVVVQNLRDHGTALAESPFAAWFPTSELGKRFADTDLKKLTDGTAPVFAALGLTPADLFHDIIGDAVVYAYAPAPAGDPKGERSIILVRPRKPEALAAVIDRLNDAQTRSKELKAVAAHKHAGAAYFERQKPDGPSDFYCFLGGVFVFSQSEAEVKAAIDRDAGAPKDRPPVLAARMTKLGVADAVAAVLLNPRPLDAEVAAKVKNAGPGERGFLTVFADAWAATDSAAVYLALDTGAELGVSVQFDPAKLPASTKGWLVGERVPSALWAAVPENAMLAVAGRFKASDLFTFFDALNAADGKPGGRETVEQALGPIVGRDKLPAVLDALGPDWGVWLAPPAKGTVVPVAVAAVKVRTDGPKGTEAAKALVEALGWGFQNVRVAYNVTHKEQLELREETDGDAVIKSLSGKGLPDGFRPCFALKGGYLLVSTSPDAIKAFRAPTAKPQVGGDVPLARFGGTSTRAYLASGAPQLAQVLAAVGVGEERALIEQFGLFATVLEPVDQVELLVRGEASGMRLMLRTKTVKPLKK
jgi:hypothetical protein